MNENIKLLNNLPPTKPEQFSITTTGLTHRLAWNSSEGAEGYNVYVGDKVIATTTECTHTLTGELLAFVYVQAFNEVGLSPESDKYWKETTPNTPLDLKVDFFKGEQGYDFDVSMLDNSVLETGYKIKYTVDGEAEQVIEASDDYILQEGETQDTEVGHKLWKAFESNGEPIKFDNGFDKSKILQAEICGNTYKNVLKTQFNNYNPSVTFLNVSASCDIGKVYTMFFSVKNFVSGGKISLNNYVIGASYLSFDVTGNGVFKKSFTLTRIDGGAFIPSVASCNFEMYDCSIVEGDYSQIPISYIPFGLTSTEATIETQSGKYSFYEPVVKGETEVVDGKLVSLESTDSSLPKLGSVPSVTDTIDLASGVLTENTIEEVFDGVQLFGNYALSSTIQGEYIAFGHAKQNLGGSSTSTSTTIICDKFTINTAANIWTNGGQCVGVTANSIIFCILKSKLTTPDVNGFKAWLQANPTTVRYQLATPVTTQLTQEQVDTYAQHKKVILLPFAEDKVTLNEDGSSTWVDASGTITLSEKDSWVVNNNTKTNTIQFHLQTDIGAKPVANILKANMHCNLFDVITASECYSSEKEGISIYDKGKIEVNILRSKLQTADLNGFKLWLQANQTSAVYQLATSVTTHIPKSLTPTIPVNKINTLSAGTAVAASRLSIVAPIVKPSVTTSFNVPSVQEKIAITASSYNSVGETLLDNAIELYMPPAFRWTYLQESKAVLLNWVDNCPADSQYRIKYRIGSGIYQYDTVAGDGAIIGSTLTHQIPLVENSSMEVSLCSAASQDGFYTSPITVSKSLDPNIKPPANISYEWIEREKVRVKWTDIYDCEDEFELFYALDGGVEEKIVIPSTSKEESGSIYTYEFDVPLSSTLRIKVRMKYDLNVSSFARVSIVNMLDAPQNIQLETVGTITTVTWDEVIQAEGYRLYLDNKLVIDVPQNSAILERDLYGFIHIVAYNSKVQSKNSEQVYVKTMPNKALWVEAGYEKTDLGYDMRVEFTDNSVIETHYRVEYNIDNGRTQSIDIDTENIELPPNAFLDEDKTYLMWQDIENKTGSDIEFQGVREEEIHKIKISGNTDDTGYYPISIGTVDPLSIAVNETITPIRFNTEIKSTGEAKKVLDVARFQEIDIIIEGKTERDAANNKLNSVKPLIYNENGIAHTITLDNCKGYTEIRYDKLSSREEYGCTLGKVGEAIDQIYKDKVIYRTKEYAITGRESWQIDNIKTNGTYTTITNVKFDNCPAYVEDEVFNVVSNKFTAQAYSATEYAHLRCMYTDKVFLMLQNSVVGITGTDSTAMKITKCKNYLMSIEPSVRYEVASPIEESKEIGLFVGDSFELGMIYEEKDVLNSEKREVLFKTEGKILTGKENWGHSPSNSTGNTAWFYVDEQQHREKGKCLVSDMFKTGNNYSIDEEMITSYDTGTQIVIKVLKSKLKSVSIEGFKEWLSYNNIKVRYLLSNGNYYTEKINILQDAFVVDSQDGGDREVYIKEQHIEEGKLTSTISERDIRVNKPLSPPKQRVYPITIVSQGYYNDFERRANGNAGIIHFTKSHHIDFGVDSSGAVYWSATPWNSKWGYVGVGRMLDKKKTNYLVVITIHDEYKWSLYYEDDFGNIKREYTSSAQYNPKYNAYLDTGVGLATSGETYINILYFLNKRVSEEELKHNLKILNKEFPLEDKSHILQTENQEEKAVNGGIESGFLEQKPFVLKRVKNSQEKWQKISCNEPRDLKQFEYKLSI